MNFTRHFIAGPPVAMLPGRSAAYVPTRTGDVPVPCGAQREERSETRVQEGELMKSDAEIRDDVIKELQWDPRITSPDAVGVAVTDGAVTLTGQVPSYAERLGAARAAGRGGGAGVRGQGRGQRAEGQAVRRGAGRHRHRPGHRARPGVERAGSRGERP